MMPQLGVLSTFHEKAALEVFHKDCLVKLGSCIAPLGQYKISQDLLQYEILTDEKKYEGNLKYGELLLLPISSGKYSCIIKPNRNVDIGFGKGNDFVGEILSDPTIKELFPIFISPSTTGCRRLTIST